MKDRRPAGDLPQVSGWLFRLFRWYTRRYLARHFHAVRIARAGRFPDLRERSALVVLNHPSWWDPLLCIYASGAWPDHTHYGPIDAAALTKYGFLGWLGLFGVERGTMRGATKFLRIGSAVLREPRRLLWVTAQGHFADVRQRPAHLEAGVGHLAARLGAGVIVPLALEYPFWHESAPEALLMFGAPIEIASTAHTPAEWLVHIESALTTTQDALAELSIRRDAAAFDTLIGGRTGVGGVYDWWRRGKAAVLGQRFRPGHGDE